MDLATSSSSGPQGAVDGQEAVAIATTTSPIYRVSMARDGRMYLAASKDIAKGTRLFSEPALLKTAVSKIDATESEIQDFYSQASQLNNEATNIFWGIGGLKQSKWSRLSKQQKPTVAWGLFNCYGIKLSPYDNSEERGMFILTSFLAQSCFPNTSRVYDPQKGHCVVYALHDVSAHHVLTRQYYDHLPMDLLTCEERTKAMYDDNGKQCLCPICASKGSKANVTNDTHRLQLQKHMEFLSGELRRPATNILNVKDAKKLYKFIDDEVIPLYMSVQNGGTSLALIYYYRLKCYVAQYGHNDRDICQNRYPNDMFNQLAKAWSMEVVLYAGAWSEEYSNVLQRIVELKAIMAEAEVAMVKRIAERDWEDMIRAKYEAVLKRIAELEELAASEGKEKPEVESGMGG